jgi:hypothetical protein
MIFFKTMPPRPGTIKVAVRQRVTRDLGASAVHDEA